MSTRHRHRVTVPLAVLLLLGVAACGGDAPAAEAPSAAASAPAATTSPAPSATAEPADDAEPAEDAGAAPAPGFDGTLVEVRYAGGEVLTAEPRVVVALGSTVRLVVTSDVADEVHVHGVDEYVPLSPGVPSSHDVVASVPGIFEVELHEAGDLLVTLQVQP